MASLPLEGVSYASAADREFDEFFNDLELSDNLADIDLLLEAERRGLLDASCEALLKEARRRGLAPPKPGSGTPLERYGVYYIGTASLFDVPMDRLPTLEEVQQVLRKISANPRMNCELELLMEVYAEVIRVFDVGDDQPERSGRLTLQKIKNLTLRKFTGGRLQRRSFTNANTENAAVVTEHLRSEIATFLAYNKSVVCLTKGVDEITGKQRYQVHSYRFEAKRKAMEVADHLRQSHEGLLKRMSPSSKSKVERVTLERPPHVGFGISVVGPKTKSESRDGVFISTLDPGSPADKHPLIRTGLQIININALSVEDYTMAEVRDAIKSSGEVVVLDLQENPHGYALYEYRAGNLKPEVNFKASEGAQEAASGSAEDQLQSLLSDLLTLSEDAAFTNPVTVVHGRSVLNG